MLHCHTCMPCGCLTSPTESATPDTPVKPVCVIYGVDRQGAACDEMPRQGATEPCRRRGVAHTARKGCLDRRRSARVGPGAPVVFLAAVCLAGGDGQPQAAPGDAVWREAEAASGSPCWSLRCAP